MSAASRVPLIHRGKHPDDTKKPADDKRKNTSLNLHGDTYKPDVDKRQPLPVKPPVDTPSPRRIRIFAKAKASLKGASKFLKLAGKFAPNPWVTAACTGYDLGDAAGRALAYYNNEDRLDPVYTPGNKVLKVQPDGSKKWVPGPKKSTPVTTPIATGVDRNKPKTTSPAKTDGKPSPTSPAKTDGKPTTTPAKTDGKPTTTSPEHPVKIGKDWSEISKTAKGSEQSLGKDKPAVNNNSTKTNGQSSDPSPNQVLQDKINKNREKNEKETQMQDNQHWVNEKQKEEKRHSKETFSEYLRRRALELWI